MALSGTLVTNKTYDPDNDWRTLTFSWTATQSIANNTSTVSWTLTTEGSYPYWVNYQKTKVVIDGATVYDRPNITQQPTGTIATGTVTLTHNSVGDRTFSVSIQAAVYYSSINATGSSTFTLNNIPRASTVTGAGLEFGSAGTLSISRASNSFTDTISYTLGTYSGTIATKTSANSVSWTPDVNMMNAIPNATSAAVAIVCQTYNGDSLVASKTSYVTVSVPAAVVPSVTAALSNTDATFSTYTQSISALGVAITASGLYGATISAYATTFEGVTYAGANVTTNVISGSGTQTVTIKATDSRGRSTTITQTISVQAYSTPQIEFSVHRCLSDGTADDMGAYVRAWIHGTGSAVTNNVVTLSLKGRQAGVSTWTDIDISADITITTDVDKESDSVIAADDTKSWEYQATVSDLKNGVVQVIAISVGYATIDFYKGGRGIAFGTTANSAGFKCAMDADFTGDVSLNGTDLATTLSSLGSMVFGSVMMHAGATVKTVTASTENKIFSYTDLDTLFGLASGTCNYGNVMVFASNGDYGSNAHAVCGTHNKSDGVYLQSVSALSAGGFRLHYLAIKF